jgi:copper(I)-binding protein
MQPAVRGQLIRSSQETHMFRILFGAAVAAAIAIFPASAHDTFTTGAIEISGAYARATLPNAPVGGGFFTITNTGGDDALIGATSPVAGEVQLHEMKMEGEVMKMKEIDGGIPVPAGQSVTLAPGGLHLMFMDLKSPLVEGEMVPVTLTFANAGTLDIEVAVGAVNAGGPGH